MNLTIHRGTKEIGGSCVEISTGKTTVLIDYGAPLDNSDRRIDLKGKKIDGVVISHPHGDHHGHIKYLDDSIPVYMGKLSIDFIQTVAEFINEEKYKNTFIAYQKDKQFEVGDIKITPYLVDHSAVDAHAFLIEAAGKTIFYTGDFRKTGNKKELFNNTLKRLRGKKIDILLMEGTCIEREDKNFPDEITVGRKIKEILSKQKTASFLASSSSTIDRLVRVSRACQQTGKTLLIDIYTAYILEMMRKVSKSTPTIDMEHIKVITSKDTGAGSHYKKIKGKSKYYGFIRKIFKAENQIKFSEVKLAPEKYLIKIPTSRIAVIAGQLFKLNGRKPDIIYSMWKGYDIYNEFKKHDHINIKYAHTSGHAVLSHLKEFAAGINYRKLIPIHTEHPVKFSEHFERVELLNDGKKIEI